MLKNIFKYNLIDATKEVAKQFPLTLAIAIAQFLLISILIIFEGDKSELYESGIRIVIVGFFGLPLSVAAHRIHKQWAIYVTLILLLISYVYYFQLESFSTPEFYVCTSILVVAHLVVSFSQKLSRENNQSFWEHNKNLFLSFITASFYAAVITAGTLTALSAFYFLIIKFNEKTYAISAIFINIIFTTIFFLSLLIEKEANSKEESNYPKALRNFASYVLAPLSLLYVSIIYLYIIKIIITQTLPEGYISWLCIVFSVIHIFTYLLLWPLKENVQEKFSQFYLRYSPYILIPVAIMMMVSIFTRTQEYGLTINRYLVIATAFWISFVIVALIISKGKTISFIPKSLAIVILVITFMPGLNFIDLTLNSQKQLFEKLLNENKLLNDKEKISFTDDKYITQDDYNRILNIGVYIKTNQRASDNYFMQFFSPKEIAELTKGKEKDYKFGVYDIKLPRYKSSTSLNQVEAEIDFAIKSYLPAMPLSGYEHLIYIGPDEELNKLKDYEGIKANVSLEIKDTKTGKLINLKKKFQAILNAHYDNFTKEKMLSKEVGLEYKTLPIIIDTTFQERKIKVVLDGYLQKGVNSFNYYLFIGKKENKKEQENPAP